MKHNSLKTLTHHQMTSTRYTRPNRVQHHLNQYLGSREIIPENHIPQHPRSHLRNMMVLFMFLPKSTNTSVLGLFLPSRIITQGSFTTLPIKDAFMLQTWQVMNLPHVRIPYMKSNLIHIIFRLHLKMRLTLFWTISTIKIIRKKT